MSYTSWPNTDSDQLMDPNQIQRHMGRLEEQVRQLTSDVHSLKQTVEQLRDIMVEARGGWRVTIAVGTIATAVAGVIAWAVNIWRG